jgi:hypothetical protein
MNQHALALTVSEALEELSIVGKFQTTVFVNTHASSRNGIVALLLDTTRKSSVERLIHQ